MLKKREPLFWCELRECLQILQQKNPQNRTPKAKIQKSYQNVPSQNILIKKKKKASLLNMY